jgi:hypothetical protein
MSDERKEALLRAPSKKGRSRSRRTENNEPVHVNNDPALSFNAALSMPTDYNQEDEMIVESTGVTTNSVTGNVSRDADVESLRLDFLDLNDANW